MYIVYCIAYTLSPESGFSINYMPRSITHLQGHCSPDCDPTKKQTQNNKDFISNHHS